MLERKTDKEKKFKKVQKRKTEEMANKGNISEEKARRIAVGATVAGVLRILFLVIIIIVQFVQIGVKNRRSRDLDRSIQEYEQLVEQGERDLNFYESELGRYHLALEQGYHTP